MPNWCTSTGSCYQAAHGMRRTTGLQNAPDFGSKHRPGFCDIAAARDPGAAGNRRRFFFGLQDKLATIAARYALPTFYPLSDYVLARDLISYGANLSESWRQAGTYVARIVKGAKPSDLPSCSRKNSSLYSTPRRPKPGGFKFHRSCSRSPTRWSSKRAV